MPVFPVLTMLPLSATVIAGAFAIVLLNRFIGGKKRPHELMWAIAFLLFAIGAACQVYADVSSGWTPFLASTFYLTGAILNVGFLALGTIYLLFRRKVANIVTALTLVVVAWAVYKLYTVPVDMTALAQTHYVDYKQLFSVDTAPRLLAAIFSGVGSIVVIGGALWSGIVFWRKRIMKDRMIGVFLLAAGTLIVAMGGTLKGAFLSDDLFYPTMVLGVLVMFFGYLQTVRPVQVPASVPVPAGATANASAPELKHN